MGQFSPPFLESEGSAPSSNLWRGPGSDTTFVMFRLGPGEITRIGFAADDGGRSMTLTVKKNGGEAAATRVD